MQETPAAVITAYLASLAFWLAAVVVIWFAGQRWPRLKDLRNRMAGQWKAALGIALVYAVSKALQGTKFNLFSELAGATMTFCQAIIGLALARGIASFEPLPVVRAIRRRERVVRSVLLFVLVAVLAVVGKAVADMLGTGIARALGEIKQSTQGEESWMPALWQLFFYFLAGAGIAEEAVYRLVIVSLFWKLTQRSWAAMLISGLLFGAYHLTPLSGMYLTFWQYPLTQFLSSIFIGIVWAYVYVKRGYETVVLAHTLGDWLPIAIYTLFMKG
ncbi:MAG: lysostaphin resistance A-like protein [Bacteroidota bacterium]